MSNWVMFSSKRCNTSKRKEEEEKARKIREKYEYDAGLRQYIGAYLV